MTETDAKSPEGNPVLEALTTSVFEALMGNDELLKFLTKDFPDKKYGTTKDFLQILARLYAMEAQLLMDYARNVQMTNSPEEFLMGMKGMKDMLKEHVLHVLLETVLQHEKTIGSSINIEKFVQDVAEIVGKNRQELLDAMHFKVDDAELTDALRHLKENVEKVENARKS